MSTNDPRPNLAARAEPWSAAHWKTAVCGCLAFAVIAVMLGGSAGTKELADSETASGETARVREILDERNSESPAAEQVLVQSPEATVADPAFRTAIHDVVDRIRALPQVTNVLSPLGQTTEGRISPDGRSALIGFGMRSDPETAADRGQPVIDATAAVQKAHPDLFIAGFGSASAVHELPETVDKDVQRAEMLSLPITLLILLVAFGALVAAGLPVILAFSGVLAATGAERAVQPRRARVGLTTSVILLIGMAVGVDYSLFYCAASARSAATGARRARRWPARPRRQVKPC